MKGTESGKDKVKRICDLLRKETLEPAETEAEQIVRSAKESAERLIQDARHEAERLIAEAKTEIQRQKAVFHSSLNQACKQTLEALKQQIEKQLLNKSLSQVLAKKMQESQVLADLIGAVLKALEKEGIEANISAYIPAAVPARDVNALLAQDLLERLREKSVLVGGLSGGVAIKLHDEMLTIDLSEGALRELVAGYIRKDFRELVFNA